MPTALPRPVSANMTQLALRVLRLRSQQDTSLGAVADHVEQLSQELATWRLLAQSAQNGHWDPSLMSLLGLPVPDTVPTTAPALFQVVGQTVSHAQTEDVLTVAVAVAVEYTSVDGEGATDDAAPTHSPTQEAASVIFTGPTALDDAVSVRHADGKSVGDDRGEVVVTDRLVDDGEGGDEMEAWVLQGPAPRPATDGTTDVIDLDATDVATSETRSGDETEGETVGAAVVDDVTPLGVTTFIPWHDILDSGTKVRAAAEPFTDITDKGDLDTEDSEHPPADTPEEAAASTQDSSMDDGVYVIRTLAEHDALFSSDPGDQGEAMEATTDDLAPAEEGESPRDPAETTEDAVTDPITLDDTSTAPNDPMVVAAEPAVTSDMTATPVRLDAVDLVPVTLHGMDEHNFTVDAQGLAPAADGMPDSVFPTAGDTTPPMSGGHVHQETVMVSPDVVTTDDTPPFSPRPIAIRRQGDEDAWTFLPLTPVRLAFEQQGYRASDLATWLFTSYTCAEREQMAQLLGMHLDDFLALPFVRTGVRDWMRAHWRTVQQENTLQRMTRALHWAQDLGSGLNADEQLTYRPNRLAVDVLERAGGLNGLLATPLERQQTLQLYGGAFASLERPAA